MFVEKYGLPSVRIMDDLAYLPVGSVARDNAVDWFTNLNLLPQAAQEQSLKPTPDAIMVAHHILQMAPLRT